MSVVSVWKVPTVLTPLIGREQDILLLTSLLTGSGRRLITVLLPLEQLAHLPSLALFVQRAQAIQPSFQLTEINAQTIARICIHLDGLPLAIELAAARIKLFPPQALLKRLSQRFQLLRSVGISIAERHRTLWATLQWSYDLLAAVEQRLFRLLSVFVGGWTLEAAEALWMAGMEPDGTFSVVDGITSLLDKSLLLQVAQNSEEPRLLMLETVREYGLACLEVSDEHWHIRRAHAMYFLDIAEKAEPYLRSSEQVYWMEQLDLEQENMRAAYLWLIGQKEVAYVVRFCEALLWYWMGHGYLNYGLEWTDLLLKLPALLDQKDLYARALHIAGDIAFTRYDIEKTSTYLETCVQLYRKQHDESVEPLLASALGILGAYYLELGEDEKAQDMLDESFALCHKWKRAWDQARILMNMGNALVVRGEKEKTLAIWEESLLLARATGDKALIAAILNGYSYYLIMAKKQEQKAVIFASESLVLAREIQQKQVLVHILGTLATAFLSQNEKMKAYMLYIEGVRLAQYVGHHHATSVLFLDIAILAALEGQCIVAGHLLGAAEALYNFETDKTLVDQKAEITEQCALLGAERFAQACEEGRHMTFEQIISDVAQLEPSKDEAPSLHKFPVLYPDDLTAREVDVLRCVTQGLTDIQIGEQLTISPRTVNAHLNSIYRKIQVSSRAAATRYAMEHHLI